MSKIKILLVEDDKDILKINSIYLSQQDYDIITAETLSAAYDMIIICNPDLIVLDVCLPDGSGISFSKKIREVTSVPIIFLTCVDSEENKVKGLMAGGDDYMTKPYGLSELAARIHALLRRVSVSDTEILEYPPLKIDTAAQRVYVNDKDAVLTPKEYKILLILVKNIGKPIDAEELYQKLWGGAPEKGIKTVHVHISSIRKKLELNYDTNPKIKTIRNAGYCFEYEKNT